jgi:hypothetical protein
MDFFFEDPLKLYRYLFNITNIIEQLMRKLIIFSAPEYRRASLPSSPKYGGFETKTELASAPPRPSGGARQHVSA